MSVVRKVELLNIPYRFYGLTIGQILLLAVAGLLGFYLATNVPNVTVINGLPLGFLVFMAVFCGGMVLVFANQIRPWQWWRNKILYTFGIRPKLYVPCRKPAPIYPDSDGAPEHMTYSERSAARSRAQRSVLTRGGAEGTESDGALK